MILVNCRKLLNDVTKNSILEAASVLNIFLMIIITITIIIKTRAQTEEIHHNRIAAILQHIINIKYHYA